MKTRLQATFGWRVPPALFALTCLLLITVAVTARIMTDDFSLLVDNTLQRMAEPTPSSF